MKRTTDKRKKRLAKRLVGCALASALVAGASYILAPPEFELTPAETAHAYELGPGVYSPDGVGAGSFIHSSGKQAYCLELMTPLHLNPGASDLPFTAVTEVPVSHAAVSEAWGLETFYNVHAGAISGDRIKEINHIYLQHGRTKDGQQAAAVQLAIWLVRYHNGGNAEYKRVYELFERTTEVRAPGTAAKARAYYQEAVLAIAAENAQTVGATTLSATANDGYSGIVEAPAGTVELKISGGELQQADGSWGKTLKFTNPLTANQTFSWRSAPTKQDGWNRYYRVEFNGKRQDKFVETPHTLSYSKDGGEQATVGPPTEKTFRLVESDFETTSLELDTLWAPIVSTQTPSEFVDHGETFADTVTLAADGTAPWRSFLHAEGTEEFLPLTAEGTLYGPFLSDPALNPSGSVPVGAPVVGKTTITAAVDKGPGEYPVQVAWQAKESGYYTWVWEIKAEQQDTAVREPSAAAGVTVASSLPENFYVTDGFGRVSERQIVPTKLEFNTKLSATEVVIGESLSDDVTVELAAGAGGWLQGDDGQRIPAVLTGQLYYSATKPVRQPGVPSDAVPIGETVTAIADQPQQTFTSDPVTVPLETESGWVTMVWCLHSENQPENYRGRIAESCDDYGVPAETAKVVRPQVVTQAQPTAAYRAEIVDTAVISGKLPQLPARVSFTAYLRPEAGAPKYDSGWRLQRGTAGEIQKWETAEVEQLGGDLCAAQPVASTAPVPVSGAGEYKSPPVVAASYGTVYWVETLEIADPKTGEYKIVHRGECGLPNETTVVERPEVRTKAVPHAVVGEEIFDTAIVTGPLSPAATVTYEVTFQAYHVPENTEKVGATELCTPENLVWESTQATPVTENGEYRSEKFKTTKEHRGKIYWVETLWQKELSENSNEAPDVSDITQSGKEESGIILTQLHRGECGEPAEITEVKLPEPKLPELPRTGAANNSAIALGGLALVITALLLFGGYRLQQNSRKTPEINTRIRA